MKVNFDYLLHFDTNTSLPNRLLFREQFEHSLPTAEEGQQLNLLPVLLLELEDPGFEVTRLGNHYRELMLKELGQGFLRHVWGIINVTRISLDRFAMLLSSPEPDHSTVEMLQQVQWVLETVFERWNLPPLSAKPSIGVAFYPCDGRDLYTLMEKAECALLHVKARGGNDFELFAPDMVVPAAKMLADQPAPLIHSRPHSGSPARSPLLYRPQFDYATRRMCGLEILSRPLTRDKQARGKDCYCSHLITVSELVDAGVVGSRTLKWLKKDRGSRITVTLSAEEVTQPELGPKLVRLLKKARLQPQHLALELAEDTLFRDLEVVSRNLDELRELGFELVLSNLEIGYTSLVYLDSRFRFDRLKINLKIVNNRYKTNRNKKRLMLTAVIQTAHRFGMRVLVSGVETEEDLTLLASLECDVVQGSKLGKPQSSRKFEQLPGPAKLPVVR